MIPNREGWHNLAVKKLLALLRGITSKNNGDFYCLSCLLSFRTKNEGKSHKNRNKDFWNVIMPSKDTEILEFNQCVCLLLLKMIFKIFFTSVKTNTFHQDFQC